MNINEEVRGNVCIIALNGRLDNESTQGFQERISSIIDGGQTRLVLDLGDLEYISSVGLRAFLLASKKLKPLEGKLVLARLQDHIKEVLDIAGFSSLFPSYPSVDEAVQNVS